MRNLLQKEKDYLERMKRGELLIRKKNHLAKIKRKILKEIQKEKLLMRTKRDIQKDYLKKILRDELLMMRIIN